MIHEQTLQFGKHPVRIVILDGAAWFTAADLYAAQRTHTDKEALSRFDRDHLRLHIFETPAGPRRLTLVSTLGALTVAKQFPKPGDRIVDAWIRKNVAGLGFGRPPLSICADGTMPVCPRASDYDGSDAWDALKRRNPDTSRNPPVDGLLELADDDKSRAPTKEEMAKLAALFFSEDELFEVVPTKPRKRRTTTRAKRYRN